MTNLPRLVVPRFPVSRFTVSLDLLCLDFLCLDLLCIVHTRNIVEPLPVALVAQLVVTSTFSDGWVVGLNPGEGT